MVRSDRKLRGLANDESAGQATGAAGALTADHGEQHAAGLAEGAENLARTRVCPHQAFRIGKHALGLQFHIEANPARIEQWLIGHTVELGKAKIDPRKIRKQTAELGARTAEAGRKVFQAWFDGALA